MTTLAQVVSAIWSMALFAGILGQVAWRFRPSDRMEKVWRAAGRVHQELWLFAPPGMLLTIVDDWHHRPWALTLDFLSVASWWLNRDWPEDNHWMRRGKKAREAVERRAGRLVVVPVEAGR